MTHGGQLELILDIFDKTCCEFLSRDDSCRSLLLILFNHINILYACMYL